MRTLVFTGKGGVGKTTVAASTAVLTAESGRRTLAISTDPAHSLADAFGEEIGHDPQEIRPGLYARQIDAQRRLEEGWGDIRDHLLSLFDWSGVDSVEAEELAILPGLDEIFALSDVIDYADSGEWDVLVIDCAPTAETLRLLSLPEILRWWMRRLWPTSRRVARAVRPVLQRMTSMPVATDEVMDSAEELYIRLDLARDLLTEPKRTSVRLVLNPEKMVVAEARRTFTYLSLFGYAVDAIIANKVLPATVTDPFFDGWKRSQAEQLDHVNDCFAPVPVLRAPLWDSEPIGAKSLAAVGRELYGEADPSDLLFDEPPLLIGRTEAGYELRLRLPFAARDELDLARRGEELLVKVGPYKRNLLLPQALRRRDVTSAAFEDDYLVVGFEEVDDALR